MNREFPDVLAGFRKGREMRDKIVNIHWILEKARKFKKNIYFSLLTTPKALTLWIKTDCGKSLKRWEYQTTWPVSWEIWLQVKKQHLELDIEQQTLDSVGWFERIALKHVYYHMWNRSPVQVRCRKQGTQSQCTGTTLRDGEGVGREVRDGGHTYTHGWFM